MRIGCFLGPSLFGSRPYMWQASHKWPFLQCPSWLTDPLVFQTSPIQWESALDKTGQTCAAEDDRSSKTFINWGLKQLLASGCTNFFQFIIRGLFSDFFPKLPNPNILRIYSKYSFNEDSVLIAYFSMIPLHFLTIALNSELPTLEVYICFSVRDITFLIAYIESLLKLDSEYTR